MRFPTQEMIFAYVLFAYLFYSTIQTLVMVPYTAMSSEISNDFDERTTINGTRLFFSQLSALICAVLPLEIVQLMPDVRTGYLVMAVVFSVFFALPFIFMFFYTKERVPHNKQKGTFRLETFIEPFRVRTFRILLGIYVCSFLTMDIVSTVFAYYMKYYMNRPGELNYVLGTMLIVQTALVPLIVKLSKKIGKARTVMAAVLVWLVGVIYIGTMQTYWPGWVIYSVAAIMGIGIGGCIVMVWTMYPDVTDVGEWVFKRRNAGSFSGVMTFMRKLSAAIGIFIVSQMLALAGYIKPTFEVVDGVTRTIEHAQPYTVITVLKFIVLVLPIVLLALTLFFAKKYPLDHKHYVKLTGAGTGEYTFI